MTQELTLNDFLEIAVQRELGTVEELETFASQLQCAYEAGEPHFGEETTLEDWTGGLEAWRGLMILVKAARQQDPDLAKRLEAWTIGKGPMPNLRIIT